MVNDGYLTVCEEGEVSKLLGYVSLTSSWHPGFEERKVEGELGEVLKFLRLIVQPRFLTNL